MISVKQRAGESAQQAAARGRRLLDRLAVLVSCEDEEVLSERDIRVAALLKKEACRRLAGDPAFDIAHLEQWVEERSAHFSAVLDRAEAGDVEAPAELGFVAVGQDEPETASLDRGALNARQAAGEGHVEANRRAAAVWSQFDSLVSTRRDPLGRALEHAVAEELRSNEAFGPANVDGFVKSKREEYTRLRERLAEAADAGDEEPTEHQSDDGDVPEAVEPCAELSFASRTAPVAEGLDPEDE